MTTDQPDAIVKKDDHEEGGQMTFFEHLVELRKRLINSLIAVGIGAFVGVSVAKYVIDFVTRPMLHALTLAHLESKLVYTHPAGVFNLMITLGIYIGLVLASPVVLYQIWLFVAPALYKHERSAVTGFLFSTVFLFLAGIAFGYYITLPYLLKFLVSFQNVSLPGIVPMITVNEYFDLTLMVLLGLGLVFETARSRLLPHALRHRHAAVPLEKYSLRRRHHRRRRRHHHSHARRHDHAHLHGSHARPLLRRYGCLLDGRPQQKQKARRRVRGSRELTCPKCPM